MLSLTGATSRGHVTCASSIRVVAVAGTGAQGGDAVAVSSGLAHREAHMDQMRLANGCG
ncbi:hypothetical protein OG243_43835 [Streptomyces sp. NBC_01318]|uniref:hypothetical protein n=1 Tax=Streptomyces sp. NBC_01318 TaxID=2903823 RepID=UPI002E12BBE8|nr:hypothetical protein OG243_00705 [Streptomyces sp. NBC_01318]WSJ55836.1 hypothetical protein OG243_43835 [Streptomyces sp. NBC_01318]